ncbi:MAG: lipoate--protein ligase family protein [Isosphaeraceae bacterium]
MIPPADDRPAAPRRVETTHLLNDVRPEIAANLAVDEALLDEIEHQGGPPTLRIWEPTTLGVVLGASSRLQQEVHVAACQGDDVPIYRRASGGGTVVIGPGALNLTVVLPMSAAPGFGAVDFAQRFVLERVAEALRDRDHLPVKVQGAGDLTLDRRKFSGSAQRRLRRHFLVHATILYQFPLPLISRYTTQPHRQPAYRAGRSHDDFVRNLPLSRDRLIAALQAAWLPDDRPVLTASVPEPAVRRLLAAKYADPEWVKRF